MNIYEILTNKVGTSWQQFHYHDPLPLIKANIIQGCYFAVMSSIDKEFLLNEFVKFRESDFSYFMSWEKKRLIHIK